MTAIAETVGHGRAKAHIAHYRPKAWRLEGGELVPEPGSSTSERRIWEGKWTVTAAPEAV